ncbi:MAG: energy transducer TonB [Candidatus Omnitrophica bacterium]|nr:energy transducer TonB [Candidatus Omnitrophota bacterium]
MIKGANSEKFAFFLSLILHIALISLLNYSLQKQSITNTVFKNKEKYQMFSTQNLNIMKTNRDISEKKTSTFLPPPYVGDIFETFKLSSQSISLEKPKIIQEKFIEVDTTEFIDINLKKLPKYMDYYWLVRSQISKIAHNIYNVNQTGFVVLNFVISREGKLLEVRFIKKSDSEILNEIALKSIYNASPFPPFPKELQDKNNLPFNLSIHFKNS